MFGNTNITDMHLLNTSSTVSGGKANLTFVEYLRFACTVLHWFIFSYLSNNVQKVEFISIFYK